MWPPGLCEFDTPDVEVEGLEFGEICIALGMLQDVRILPVKSWVENGLEKKEENRSKGTPYLCDITHWPRKECVCQRSWSGRAAAAAAAKAASWGG